MPNKIIWNEKKIKLALICEDVLYSFEVNYDKIEEYIEKVVDRDKGEMDVKKVLEILLILMEKY